MTLEDKYNEMTCSPVKPLVCRLAVPTIIAMVTTALYNVVDAAFIGRLSTGGTAGIGISFGYMTFIQALGFFFGHGSGNFISRALGAKDASSASVVASVGVVTPLILGLLTAVVCLPNLSALSRLLGATPDVVPYANDYLRYIVAATPFMMAALTLNNQLRLQGNARFAMIGIVSGAVINIALDPLFIFVLGMGIKGAATATILAQFISLVWQFKLLSNKDEMLHLHRGIYGLRPDIIRQIIAIGMSPFLMNLCACLVVLFINKGMKQYGGDTAIAAYGIVNRVVFLFLMMVMGLNQGMQPIVGYNWGARQNPRVWKTLRLTIACAEAVVITGFVMGEFFPNALTHLFTDNASIVRIADRGFRIDVSVFPIVGAQMVIGNFFQSIGHAGKSIFQSLTRQLLFLIPGLILLPPHFGLDGVWLAIPVSDVLSFFVSLSMLWWLVRKVNGREGGA